MKVGEREEGKKGSEEGNSKFWMGRKGEDGKSRGLLKFLEN